MTPPLERLAQIEAIKQLKARYFRLVDTKQWDAVRALFSDGALVTVAGDVIDVDTYMQTRGSLLERAISVHQGHLPEVELTSEHTARGAWANLAYVELEGEVGQRAYTRCVEEYRRDGEEWRIVASTSEVYRRETSARALPAHADLPRLSDGWITATAGPSPMELIDIEAIKQLKARYFRCLDTKQWDQLVDQFAGGARFDIPSLPPELDRHGFVGRLSKRHGTAIASHHGHTPEIAITGTESARGIWPLNDIVEHAGSDVGSHEGFGHYEEEYTRTPDGWKIAFMRLSYIRDDRLGVEAAPPGRYESSSGWLADAAPPGVGELADVEEIVKLKARQCRLLAGKGDVHHAHMPEIRFVDERTARGVWAIENILDGGGTSSGHVEEEYRRDGDVWEITASRVARLRRHPA